MALWCLEFRLLPPSACCLAFRVLAELPRALCPGKAGRRVPVAPTECGLGAGLCEFEVCLFLWAPRPGLFPALPWDVASPPLRPGPLPVPRATLRTPARSQNSSHRLPERLLPEGQKLWGNVTQTWTLREQKCGRNNSWGPRPLAVPAPGTEGTFS